MKIKAIKMNRIELYLTWSKRFVKWSTSLIAIYF